MPKLSLRGPAYKVIVQVEGIRTQALIDFKAQVTLIRSQMLPMIRKKQGWSLKSVTPATGYLSDSQLEQVVSPWESAVTLKVQVEATRVINEVLCFVLDSSKPL